MTLYCHKSFTRFVEKVIRGKIVLKRQMKYARSHLKVQVVRWKFVYDYWDLAVSYSLFAEVHFACVYFWMLCFIYTTTTLLFVNRFNFISGRSTTTAHCADTNHTKLHYAALCKTAWSSLVFAEVHFAYVHIWELHFANLARAPSKILSKLNAPANRFSFDVPTEFGTCLFTCVRVWHSPDCSQIGRAMQHHTYSWIWNPVRVRYLFSWNIPKVMVQFLSAPVTHIFLRSYVRQFWSVKIVG